MPPIAFIAAAQATYAAQAFTAITPTTSAIGDTALMIVGLGEIANTVIAPDGWEIIATITGATRRIVILRHEIAEDDGPSHVFPLAAVPVNLSAAVLAVWRGPRAGGGAPDGSYRTAFANVAASANFPVPSIALDAYSDILIGVCLGSSALAATPPATTTERFDAASGLYVFDLLKEAPGATGVLTAVYAGAQANGIAAAIAIGALPTYGASAGIRFDPPGAIGLPTEGV